MHLRPRRHGRRHPGGELAHGQGDPHRPRRPGDAGERELRPLLQPPPGGGRRRRDRHQPRPGHGHRRRPLPRDRLLRGRPPPLLAGLPPPVRRRQERRLRRRGQPRRRPGPGLVRQLRPALLLRALPGLRHQRPELRLAPRAHLAEPPLLHGGHQLRADTKRRASEQRPPGRPLPQPLERAGPRQGRLEGLQRLRGHGPHAPPDLRRRPGQAEDPHRLPRRRRRRGPATR